MFVFVCEDNNLFLVAHNQVSGHDRVAELSASISSHKKVNNLW